MKFGQYISAFLLAAISIPAFAQTDSSFLSHVINKLEQQPATEKVYLHLDKQNYFLGDTIWYKAYTVIGQHHQLSALSGVLYVELVSPKDSVVSRQTLHLLSGVAWGEIPLARSFKQGNYHIRAYTNWMRNAGPGNFYNQKIRIGGVAPVLATQTKQKNPDVQFFPEGGQLVNGVRSRIAIKAVNNNGLGEDIKGTIEDNEGNIVADFATRHLGMGVFALIPQSGKTYKAKISIPGETAFTVELPKAQDEGYTLTLNNSQVDSVFIKIAVNDKTFNNQKNHTFYILAQNNGKIYYTSQGKLESLSYAAKVEKSRFPTGITQFTLFSQSGEPLAERIAFVQSADTLNLNLNTTSQSYATRQKVAIAINAKDNNNKPTTGSFSVAVINESRIGIDENSESTILNNLLLTSDLQGYIEQPNYYFTNVSDQTKSDLDVLMLTQGYRRFDWKQVLNNVTPKIVYQPEKSLELIGSLKTPSGKPIPNGKINLVATKENFLTDTVTDINGNFKFMNLNLPDTAKVVLRARKENNGSNVAIYVQQPNYAPLIKQYEPGPATANPAPGQAAELLKNYADYQKQLKEDSLQNSRRLKEVVIKDKTTPKPDIYNSYGAVMEHDVDMKKLAAQGLPMTLALVYDLKQVVNVPYHGPVQFMIDGFVRKKDDFNYFSPKEVESIRMIDATGVSPATVILTTKRYAHTDTSSTALKEVQIKDKAARKPDIYNNYGSVMEYAVNMKMLNSEFLNVKDAMMSMVPGLHYVPGGGQGFKFFYEHEMKRPVQVIIDGFKRTQDDLNTYSPRELESIRMIASTGSNPPTLVLTSKRYAGTDTISTALKGVVIKERKARKEPDLSRSANLNPGSADQVIMGDQLGSCINLSDCLTGRVHFGDIEGMSVIVDGNILGNGKDYLNQLNPSEIYSIEVLYHVNARSIYGSSIKKAGALVITMKNGGESSYVTSVNPAGLITYPFKGFYKAKTFYSPKYDHPKTDTDQPDLRSTIYWNPNIITDKDGKASIEYFNNDTKGTYRVVIEGIDDNGNLGRQVYRYKVE